MSELKKDTLEMINNLDGYHQAFRSLHWQTTSHAEHLLSEDIDNSILSYEDKLAECVMGRTGERYSVGDIKPYVPHAKDMPSLLRELEQDAQKFRDTLGEDRKNIGLINIVEDLIEDICKWNYLRTLK